MELATIETPPELILFNAYLSAEKDLERERQRLRQSEVAKDRAAAQLKEAQAGGTREEVAAAEAEYRQRVEEWQRVRDGEAPDAAPASDDATGAGGAETGVDGAEVDEDRIDEDRIDEDAADGDAAGDVESTVTGEPAEAPADAGSPPEVAAPAEATGDGPPPVASVVDAPGPEAPAADAPVAEADEGAPGGEGET